MNFSELPDKDLDNVFRKASESVDYPVNEDSWKAVKEQLDGWERFTSFFWRILETGSLILLISTILLIWQINGNLTSDYTGLRSAAQYGEIIDDQESDNLIADDLMINQMEKPEDPLSQDGGDKTISGVIPDKIADPDFIETEEVSKQNYRFNVAEEQNSAINENLNTHSVIEKNNERILDKSDIVALRSIPPGSVVSTPEISDTNSDKKIIVSNKPHQFGYSIGVSVGPDFSFVNSEKIGTGTYLGLIVDLNILKRINIVSGVYHTRKRYPVEGVYSIPDYGGNYINQNPQSIDIACHIIEIPLNLNYDLLQNPAFRIYTGIGLSSYLMLTEEYSFNSGYGSNQQEELIIKNENQHYFGILNISAGYTKYFDAHWAFQIEPFYKFPLQDIASANVRLNSFGMYFSLKYKIK